MTRVMSHKLFNYFYPSLTMAMVRYVNRDTLNENGITDLTAQTIQYIDKHFTVETIKPYENSKESLHELYEVFDRLGVDCLCHINQQWQFELITFVRKVK